MMGLQIDKNDHFSVYGSISSLFIILSLALGIWLGPNAMFWSSGVGVAIATYGLVRSTFKRFPFIVVSAHSLLLVIGIVLKAYFLMPLTMESQKIPPLRYTYVDPGGFFSVRGPKDWEYQDLGSIREAGVRIRPTNQNQYMGVSEILIFIRKLDTPPKSPENFLQSMAWQGSDPQDNKRKVFDFSTTPAELLNREKGIWSFLDVKRFWVPVRQISLIGIKNKRYLCSVSAIGLKYHATVSNVLCLGLFETIKITNP